MAIIEVYVDTRRTKPIVFEEELGERRAVMDLYSLQF